MKVDKPQKDQYDKAMTAKAPLGTYIQSTLDEKGYAYCTEHLQTKFNIFEYAQCFHCHKKRREDDLKTQNSL